MHNYLRSCHPLEVPRVSPSSAPVPRSATTFEYLEEFPMQMLAQLED